MPLVLECREKLPLPVQVRGVLPRPMSKLTRTQIEKFPIIVGCRNEELGSIFQVLGDSADSKLIMEGHLQNVHWIGHKLTGGTIETKSSIGRHAGSRMSGGRLMVHGDATDFVGVEMSGGWIQIDGDAGDIVGGNYPGSNLGMNRGTIVIHGSAGAGLGQQMRRGTIVVCQNAGDLIGWNMVAGSILVVGNAGNHVGLGMKRGSIFLFRKTELPPSFRAGGMAEFTVAKMLASFLGRHVGAADFSALHGPLRLFHGDQLTGGKGEIFQAAS
ncbi:MAG: formylmethanofuran dehydrogenase subunit C [Planctomycetota bacterium]